ncbi:MAG: hypothetical protein ACLS89_02250 [Collinsella sp.]
MSDSKDGLATLGSGRQPTASCRRHAHCRHRQRRQALLFRTGRTNIHPSTNSTLGVDVRCDGSFVVAAGSIPPQRPDVRMDRIALGSGHSHRRR